MGSRTPTETRSAPATARVTRPMRWGGWKGAPPSALTRLAAAVRRYAAPTTATAANQTVPNSSFSIARTRRSTGGDISKVAGRRLARAHCGTQRMGSTASTCLPRRTSSKPHEDQHAHRRRLPAGRRRIRRTLAIGGIACTRRRSSLASRAAINRSKVGSGPVSTHHPARRRMVSRVCARSTAISRMRSESVAAPVDRLVSGCRSGVQTASPNAASTGWSALEGGALAPHSDADSSRSRAWPRPAPESSRPIPRRATRPKHGMAADATPGQVRYRPAANRRRLTRASACLDSSDADDRRHTGF
jgi:hypothetical protein